MKTIQKTIIALAVIGSIVAFSFIDTNSNSYKISKSSNDVFSGGSKIIDRTPTNSGDTSLSDDYFTRGKFDF
jgi:hypothetical protein